MAVRRLPNSHTTRLMALRVAFDRLPNVPATEVPFTAATLARINSFYPIYRGLDDQVSIALNAQTANTAQTAPFANAARMWVSHGFQALFNACDRGEFPQNVKTLYKRPVSGATVPDMRSEQAILEAAVDYITGETNRTAQGGDPITFPSLANIQQRVDAFRDSNMRQADHKNTYDLALEARAAQVADADKLILKMWNEIETAYNEGDRPSMRRKAREWGVVYVPSKGETPSAEDYSVIGLILDSATRQPLAEVEVGLDGSDISVTTDSEGRYYLPFTTAGSYTLRASLDGYVTHTQPVTIADSTLPEVNIALVREGEPMPPMP
jgi:hypothetical protein